MRVSQMFPMLVVSTSLLAVEMALSAFGTLHLGQCDGDGDGGAAAAPKKRKKRSPSKRNGTNKGLVLRRTAADGSGAYRERLGQRSQKWPHVSSPSGAPSAEISYVALQRTAAAHIGSVSDSARKSGRMCLAQAARRRRKSLTNLTKDLNQLPLKSSCTWIMMNGQGVSLTSAQGDRWQVCYRL